MKTFTVASLLPATILASALQGFNYGALNPDQSATTQQQYQTMFANAKTLVGTSGFSAARLFTMIQGGNSNNAPTSAIPAAIATNTSLLLGMWASGGQQGMNNEMSALGQAVSQYGKQFTDLIMGISVGSEDLYRDSVTGVEANDGIGAGPDVLVTYLSQVRTEAKNLALNVPIGHVDTWTAWVNGSNAALVPAVDFLGVDAYPYFQSTMPNSIAQSPDLFFDAYNETVAVAKGKPVWITETGFPVSGNTSGQAVPSVANAQAYWDGVACRTLGKINTFWYTLFDAGSSPSFGIVGQQNTNQPLFDLTCAGIPASS